MSIDLNQLDDNIYEAVNSSNPQLARQCAARLKEMGDDEQAERLLKLANGWDDTDHFSHDEA